MIAVVRIAGQVKKQKDDKETLLRLNLPRKFSCVFIDEKDKVLMGMVESVASSVAYGKVDEKFMKEVEKKRGKGKRFFALAPPVGGFRRSSKVAAPRGILGKHDDISKLIERMLGEHSLNKSEVH